MATKIYALPEHVIQKILNYLGSRPWSEVDPLFNSIKGLIVEIPENDIPKSAAEHFDRVEKAQQARAAARRQTNESVDTSVA